MSQQNEQLLFVENLCHSFLGKHDKAVMDMQKKLFSSRALYDFHIEAFVHLHKASSNAALEEVSSLASSNSKSIEEFLASELREATSIFDGVQSALSAHQGEMRHFAKELR